jgi:EmrB/QacA subfamily drug resistance transporter
MTRGSKILLVTSVGVMMSGLDATITNVARDAIGHSLRGSDSSVSWVLSGYSIVFAAVLLTSGRLADRYGRKRIYHVGLLVFVFASALCGLAPVLWLLIAARALQAIGAAFIFPASLALALAEFPMERRSTALAVWGIVGATAAAAGPTLGSLIVQISAHWGWRIAFMVNVPVGLTGWYFGRRLLKESSDPDATGIPDPISIVSGVLAVGLIALAFTESNDWGFIGPKALAAYGVSVVLLAVFVWRCRVSRLPVLDLAMLRQRAFATASSAGLLFAIPFYGSLVCDITFLLRQWHYSVLAAGVASSLTPVASILASRLTGRLCDKHGHRPVLVPGALFLVLGAFLRMWTLPAHAAYWSRFALPLALTGLGIGTLIPGLQSAAVKFLPLDRMAMGSAFYTTIRQLGSGLAVAITIALLTRRGHPPMVNFRATFLLHGVVGLLCVAVILLHRPPADTSGAAHTPLVTSSME